MAVHLAIVVIVAAVSPLVVGILIAGVDILIVVVWFIVVVSGVLIVGIAVLPSRRSFIV